MASLFCSRNWKKLAIVSAVQSVAPEKLAIGKNPRFSAFRFYCFTSFINEILWIQWLKTLSHTFFQTPFETTMCVCVASKSRLCWRTKWAILFLYYEGTPFCQFSRQKKNDMNVRTRAMGARASPPSIHSTPSSQGKSIA